MDFTKYYATKEENELRMHSLSVDRNTDEYKELRAQVKQNDKNTIERFKNDLFVEFGIEKHPLREKFWNFVWQYGHAHGLTEVYVVAQDAIELLDTSLKEKQTYKLFEIESAGRCTVRIHTVSEPGVRWHDGKSFVLIASDDGPYVTPEGERVIVCSVNGIGEMRYALFDWDTKERSLALYLFNKLKTVKTFD